MTVQIASQQQLEDWVRLRARLWPDTTDQTHREEALALLGEMPGSGIAFLDSAEGQAPRAFAEATLRHDHVNGCESSPVAFLEGIYVEPEHRATGVGRGLLDAVAKWARGLNCKELASDAALDNRASRAFHKALGFDETEELVFFRRSLGRTGDAGR